MINLLESIAPQTSGRALFSARPAPVLPLPNEAAGMVRFDEALRVAQVTVLDIDAPVDDALVAGQEPKAQSEPADDRTNHDADAPADEQRLCLLPSLAPIAVPAPTAIPVETTVVVATADTEGPVVVASVPASIAAAPTTSSAAPAVVPGMPNDVSLAFERGRAALRAVVNTPNSTTAVVDESVAAVPVATTTASVTATIPPRGGVKESVSGTAERAVLLLGSQPQYSQSAAPMIGSEPLAANAASQPGAVARQSLAALLGEQLHVQVNQRSEHAVIRLDPPSMGTIEIIIRHEAGAVQVQLRASNAEVARQLHAIGDTLRQDLVQRQHSDVSVQVSDGSRDADGRQRQRHATPWQDEPGRALSEAGEERESAAFVLNAE